MAKSSSPWLWFVVGAALAYVLHGQIQGIVGQIKGSFSGRSAFYLPTAAYHVKTPRLGSRPLGVGWARPGFPGHGHAYGRLRNPYY